MFENVIHSCKQINELQVNVAMHKTLAQDFSKQDYEHNEPQTASYKEVLKTVHILSIELLNQAL